jgi:hypothetical protein
MDQCERHADDEFPSAVVNHGGSPSPGGGARLAPGRVATRSAAPVVGCGVHRHVTWRRGPVARRQAPGAAVR